MKKSAKSKIKALLLPVIVLLIAASVTVLAGGCKKNNGKTEPTAQPVATEEPADNTQDGRTSLGTGAVEFFFDVKDADGNETKFTIHTDKATVGEALLELKLIEGEESAYGLYVKTVNGKTYDYNEDGKYWAFYIGGEYASTGVDSTNVEAGQTYAFRAE